jgi:hypothetical protein
LAIRLVRQSVRLRNALHLQVSLETMLISVPPPIGMTNLQKSALLYIFSFRSFSLPDPCLFAIAVRSDRLVSFRSVSGPSLPPLTLTPI